MTKRIVLIQGHPDPQQTHLGHALASAYADGAIAAGHEIKRIEVAQLDFPFLRTKVEFDQGTPPSSIQGAQEAIKWAEHLVLFYPLWLGTMPALLKGFLEQVFRPGFALTVPEAGKPGHKLLKGKSARIVVTMGMPAFFFRWFYHAHSLKGLERNILSFCGIGPIKESLFGLVEAADQAKREKWLAKMQNLGRSGK
jgi:putative NADPH-quinone reductase